MSTKYFSHALLLGMVFSLFTMTLSGQRKTADAELGIMYWEVDQKIRFLEDTKDTRRTVLDVDEETVGIDDSKLEQYWIFGEYSEGTSSIWVEYLNYDDDGVKSMGNRFFKNQFFSGDVKTTYEAKILQAIMYEKGEMGELGIGFTGVRQELTQARVNQHTERLDLPMLAVRWRYIQSFSEQFYLRAEAQYMSAVEEAQGHDLQAEIGYNVLFKNEYNRVDKESFRISAGYREFKVKGDVGDGKIDMRMTGPYIKLTLSTGF